MIDNAWKQTERKGQKTSYNCTITRKSSERKQTAECLIDLRYAGIFAMRKLN